ncbi:MAG: hypothetical protein Alpg2KO_19070 [Alphaproteobacteria bacterium]
MKQKQVACEAMSDFLPPVRLEQLMTDQTHPKNKPFFWITTIAAAALVIMYLIHQGCSIQLTSGELQIRWQGACAVVHGQPNPTETLHNLREE